MHWRMRLPWWARTGLLAAILAFVVGRYGDLVLLRWAWHFEQARDSQKTVWLLRAGLATGLLNEIDATRLRLGNLYLALEDYEAAIPWYEAVSFASDQVTAYGQRMVWNARTTGNIRRDVETRLVIGYLKAGRREAALTLAGRMWARFLESGRHADILELVNLCAMYRVALPEFESWSRAAAEALESLTEDRHRNAARGAGRTTVALLLATLGRFNEAARMQETALAVLADPKHRAAMEWGRIQLAVYRAAPTGAGERALLDSLAAAAAADRGWLENLAYFCNLFDVGLEQAVQWTGRALALRQEASILPTQFASPPLPGPGTLRGLHAELLFKTGRVDEAIAAARAAIDEAPNADLRRKCEAQLRQYRAAVS